MKFRGHAHRSLDDKGRLILPPSFKDLILENVPEGYIVLTVFNNQVIGITPTQWDHIESEIEKIKAPDPDVEETKLMLYACYTEVAVNKQGRIALPAQLRKTGGLESDVEVMGAGNHFQIRPAGSFEELMSRRRNIAPQMAEYNVDLKL
ncbi:division/cell wall cluster transcriptional repressor MraZ [Pseudodesulfovibrio cashew]|uniref:Transcriptional regulator MraZ n=1 Tax=Pseudodesulfovibrio cashew TaxID=2678688 RepID=A0A6I6JDC2_9BACT|nr:division/cell wall cluster transcriptional repressor MraZ [Pseudodesulfovibrio cashew]QGY40121.1 division/cell wall cluster transcriptional repressor MraZ [Pseudodesulfovibrio cashew]